MSWSPYPSEPRQRRSTIARDVLVLLALTLLAWLGRRVYQLVDNLSVVTDSVDSAGNAVQDGFGAAADALAGAPLIGDEVAEALLAAGSASGGNVVQLASSGDSAIHRVALILGLLTFTIPALIMLVLYLPMRVAQTRRLRSSRLVFREEHDPARRPLLAMRAALSLPTDHLLRFSRDPIGDLVRGDHEALVAALLADAGLAPTVSAETPG